MAAQVVRSVSEWSYGVKTEKSIQEAYIELIENSQNFIYIENQFFLSAVTEHEKVVQNKIGNAILLRISRAIQEEKSFRVFVILPEHPEGSVKDLPVKQVMYWEYQTIFGQNSIFDTLKTAFPEQNISNYITFHSLRNYDVLENTLLTEQIYVHAKVMIVDDCKVIIGSVIWSSS